MKKVLWILLPLFLIAFAGCKDKDGEGTVNVYYLNLDATAIEAEEYPKEDFPENPKDKVAHVLDLLQTDPLDTKHRKTIPDKLYDHSETSGIVYSVYFTDKYYKLEPTEEVLTRAAIVRTIVQFEPYVYVNFYVDGEPLVNSDGIPIGNMNADSFIENAGSQINKTEETELTLYFTDKKGVNLIEQKSTVSYVANKSLEKVVIDKLMDGPNDSGLVATIPSGANLINTNVADGICYVNFDETFINNQTDAVAEDVVLFSIVNSLCALPNIDKVQIQINGNTDRKLRYNYQLDTTYSPDDSLVVNTEADENETEEPKEKEDN